MGNIRIGIRLRGKPISWIGNVTPLINVKWKNKAIANVAPKIEMQKHGKGV